MADIESNNKPDQKNEATSIPDQLRDIRRQLRHAMNGIASTSMRNQGLAYKINFGVSLPSVKQMALKYEPNADLAETLWKENVRELKLLATLLHPLEAFSEDIALRWISEVKHQEIAEQLTMNLLLKTSYAKSLAHDLLSSQEEFPRVIAFLLHAYLCMQEKPTLPQNEDRFLAEARAEMDKGELTRKSTSAVLAVKRYGRISKEKATSVLNCFKDYEACGQPIKEEFYADLFFELDYYLQPQD